MKSKNINTISKGVSIIEILVAVVIITVAFLAILSLINFSLKFSILTKETNRATLLAQEEMEGIINFRNETTWDINGIGTLATESSYPYYLQLNELVIPPEWTIVQGTETIDIFTRKIVFDNVSRASNGDIESTYNPANNDLNTRKVTVTVSWKDKKVELFRYITNWKK